ncbi:hypothetical protein JHK85_054659 [Glycine max]|nr:hypothetical protein JHK85_054659 [Glycine max]KHN02471.1 hypothetical protein glysoja_002495 [Glycine soja]
MTFCRSPHQSSTAVGVINPNSITFLANLRSMKKKTSSRIAQAPANPKPDEGSGAKSNMLQFYTDDAFDLKISPPNWSSAP